MEFRDDVAQQAEAFEARANKLREQYPQAQKWCLSYREDDDEEKLPLVDAGSFELCRDIGWGVVLEGIYSADQLELEVDDG